MREDRGRGPERGPAGAPAQRPLGARSRSRATALAESFPLWLGALILVGLGLRVVLTYIYEPAVLAFADTPSYISMAAGDLFSDYSRPTGYSIFLRGTHAISNQIEVTIAVQHLLGLATGVLMYLTVRRVGGPLWVGLIAAAAVVLSLDQIYLEHTIASEALFTFLVAAGLYCGARALDDERLLRGPLTNRHLWLVGCGLLLGLSAWVRAVAVPMIPFLALWALLAIPGGWRARLLRGVAAGGPAVAVVLLYFVLNQSATGTFGITQMDGWATYARAAPFADCTQFDPPAGTDALCESTPPGDRFAPDFYTWQPGSPARKLFGYPPAGDEQLGEFGRQAILHQPLDYAGVVVRDFARFFAPGINADQPFAAGDYDLLAIDRRDPPIEQLVRRSLRVYFPSDAVHVAGGAAFLTDVQQVVRVHPIILLVALVLACLGTWAARGRVRWAIVLLAGFGGLLLALTAVTATYGARYAIPADGPVIAGGALGLWALISRGASRRSRIGSGPRPGV